MEAYLLTLARVLPVAEVSRQTGVTEDRIWHLIRTRVDEDWKAADWSSLERLGVDETSTRKGHKYGTVFLEIDGQDTERGRGASKVARLLFFTPGKDAKTFNEFVEELERREVPAEQINEIAMDMTRQMRPLRPRPRKLGSQPSISAPINGSNQSPAITC